VRLSSLIYCSVGCIIRTWLVIKSRTSHSFAWNYTSRYLWWLSFPLLCIISRFQGIYQLWLGTYFVFTVYVTSLMWSRMGFSYSRMVYVFLIWSTRKMVSPLNGLNMHRRNQFQVSGHQFSYKYLLTLLRCKSGIIWFSGSSVFFMLSANRFSIGDSGSINRRTFHKYHLW
jgi:hypothetical protein